LKTWIKAAGIAALVELPMLWVLVKTPPTDYRKFIPTVVGWYHLFAVWFGYYVLTVWNPGPRPGPTVASNTLYWFSVFVLQVLLTTPVVVVLMRRIASRLARDGQ